MKKIAQAFEKWYIEEYWNFRAHSPVSYHEPTDSYDHFDVNLAYQAFKQGIVYEKEESKAKESSS